MPGRRAYGADCRRRLSSRCSRCRSAAAAFSYQLDSMFGKKDDASLTGALQPAAPALKPVADLRRKPISSSPAPRSARS